MSDVIAAEAAATAEEFLAKLSPGAWEDLGWWAFRGVGNAEWSLVPSVLRLDPATGKPPWLTPAVERRESELGKISPWPPRTPALARIRHTAETGLFIAFRHLADRVGLALPEDSAELRSWRRLLAMIDGEDPSRWPDVSLFSQLALAQHYGIPTRLLDWTWKPRVAAYFAARDACKRGATSGALAVWALHTNSQEVIWDGDPPEVEIVHAPQAPNPNLSAQAGLFTLARHVHEDVGFESVLAEKFKGPGVSEVLRKMTLPVAAAPALMKQLRAEGVSAATVFPGYAGVVEALEERKWFAHLDTPGPVPT